MTEYAQTLDFKSWPAQKSAEPIIKDLSLLEQNTMATAKSLTFSLSSEQTDLLFGKCNSPFLTEATDFMLSSLALAYSSSFNLDNITIGIEGHGREPWNGDIDISRTVGWFTSLFPVTIEVSQSPGDLDVLKQVKDLRKLTPNNGIDYGILRHLSKKSGNVLKDDKIQVSFNYLGRFQQLENQNSFFQTLEAPFNFDICEVAEEWKRNHVFDINTGVKHNCFEAEIVFSTALHSEEVVSKWLESWKKTLVTMIDQTLELQTVEHTRSDFPLLKLPEREFNLLYHKTLSEVGITPDRIEDILPCTHLQEGLIVGLLRASNYYHVQQTFELVGDFDFEKLKNAWNVVIQDHANLHSIFVQNEATDNRGSTFVQVAIKNCVPQWTHVVCGEESLAAELDAYLINDKKNDFKLGQPTMRFALLESGNKRLMVTSWHHAILDATSWNLVLQDVSAVYSQTERPKTHSFKSFVASLRNRSDTNIEEEKKYWQSQISLLESLPFPKLSTSKEVESTILHNSGTIDIPMQEITHFAQQSKVTIFTLVKAAWALLLRAYTQSEDVIFGYTMSGRNSELEGIATMIGPCLNTLPSRIRCIHDMSIIKWLESIHEGYISAFSYQQSSLRDIQGWAGVSPLFDTIIDYKSVSVLPKDDTLLGENGNKLQFVETTGDEATEYPVGLSVESDNTTMTYNLHINTAMASELHAQSLTNEFKAIFERIVKAPANTKLEHLFVESSQYDSFSRNLPYLANHERTTDLCIHTLFEEQVRRNPENIAVQFETSEFVSYGELNKKANRLAHHLIKHGVGPDVVVPLCMDKSIAMIVAMLAVLKAGGAYVPLDPKNPVERNLFIIHETKSTIVISSDCYQHFFQDQTVIPVEKEDELYSQYSTENPEVVGLSPSNLCYILFTSGSTGTPKGVMLEHSAVCNSIWAHEEVWHLDGSDSVLQFATYTFDVSVVEIFVTLAFGARVAMAPKERLLTDLGDVITTMNITSAMLTTTIASCIDPSNAATLKRMMVGGEMMTTAVRNSWSSFIELNNVYGPTEAAVAFLVNHKIDEKSLCSNIGRTMGSNVIYILGLDLNPVPLGVVGELCVSGPQLARGYLNRPDLTEAAFISNPFISGERLYRTGDLARFNIDGSVELIGRKDNQIKLHGLRIELDEIEHALYEHLEIGRACVLPLVTDSSTNHKALVAFMTFNDLIDNDCPLAVLNAADTPQAVTYTGEVRNLVKKRLPPYMVPTVWVPLTKMPTNSSGKIDRKLVATIYESTNKEELLSFSASDNSDYVGASTQVEEDWLQLWAKVLNISEKRIGIHDSFFSLGGDSIIAVRLVGAARQFGYELSVQQLYEQLTIAELANNTVIINSEDLETRIIPKYELLKLEADELDHLLDVDVEQNGISLANVEDVYPCSPLQEGLIALGLQDNSSYLTQQVYRCESIIDPDNFLRAWKSVIQANPILRSTIVFSNSGYSHLSGLQVVLGSDNIDWNIVDVENDDLSESHLAEILDTDIKKGINVGQLLTRFTIIRVKNSMAYFVWTIHHALYDGWSMSLLIADLVKSYQLQELPARPSYNNFIKYISDVKKEESLAYWKNALADVETLLQ
ncbi:hypothetical protein K7432_014522 [Basidiobolus ranarum]|uniref:Carrier domain-containing protein n=1 Tax=Basidiobolus ranarum TaxID=34480 RepID=A0ABR2VPE2_9FUNG